MVYHIAFYTKKELKKHFGKKGNRWGREGAKKCNCQEVEKRGKDDYLVVVAVVVHCHQITCLRKEKCAF